MAGPSLSTFTSDQNYQIPRTEHRELELKVAQLEKWADEFEKRMRDWCDQFEKRVFEQFEAAKDAVRTAMDSAEKAVTKAETASEKRFEGVNEFRAVLTDQSKNFITRTEVDTLTKATAERSEAQARSLIDKIDGVGGVGSRLQELNGTLIGLQSRVQFKDEAGHEKKEDNRWTIGLIVAIITAIATFGFSNIFANRQALSSIAPADSRPQIIVVPSEVAGSGILGSPSNSSITTPLAPGSTVAGPKNP